MQRPSSEQRFQLLIDQAVDTAMIVADTDGLITDWSAGAARLFGWSALEACGQPLTMLLAPQERQAGIPAAVPIRWLLAKDGAGFACDATVTQMLDDDGAALGLGMIVRAAAASRERLRKTEEQLRLATEAAQLGIWSWDVRHDVVSWENGRMHEIFGVSGQRQDINAARLMGQYLHRDDVEQFRQAARRTLDHGQRFHFVGRFCRLPERELRWLELTGILQARSGDDGATLTGTAADITERKRDEEALSEARLRLEATMSAAEVASWIWDIPNDRVIADRNLTGLFGIPDALAGGAPLAAYVERVHPDDLEQLAAQVRHAIDTGEPYRSTYRIAHPELPGAWRWVNARGRVAYDEQGNPASLNGVVLDITRQRELQDASRVTEERYHTLITSMDQAFGFLQVLLDADGKPADYRFEVVNRALEQQSGLVNVVGRTIRELVPDIESKWINIYGRVAQSRQPARFVEHSAAMGYWWDVYATPMGEPDELRVAILFTDVTARKQAEENLRQLAADLSDANRRKMEFLATLAHELRNPLAPLRTGLDLLRLGGKIDEGSSKVVGMMDRQLRQMVHLIDDLMDVSRINSGKIVLKTECIDIADAVQAALEAIRPTLDTARHALSLQLLGQAAMVQADPTRLTQILVNLLTNAAKYTPHGGRIGLLVRLDGDAVKVDVSDNGIGIALEEQAGVFEMFSQVAGNLGRAQGGLGIGLSLVRSLVEMHGGAIALDSTPGQGSTFTLSLPLAPECGLEPDAHHAGQERAGGRLPGLRVLVADDNLDAAAMLVSLLRAAGHAAHAVHDGLAALEQIASAPPELAILDIGMPGLNGYEVAQRVRANPALAKVMLVALTGWGGERDRERSQRAGFDAHLTKPAGFAELKHLMADLAGRR